MIGAREPGLQQRTVGREREEWQPDRHREQGDEPERFRAGRRPLPTARNGGRQRGDRGGHDDEGEGYRYAARSGAGEPVSARIAGEQGGLKESNSDRPARWRPATTR